MRLCNLIYFRPGPDYGRVLPHIKPAKDAWAINFELSDRSSICFIRSARDNREAYLPDRVIPTDPKLIPARYKRLWENQYVMSADCLRTAIASQPLILLVNGPASAIDDMNKPAHVCF